MKVVEIALERLAQAHAALAFFYDHEAELNAEIERQLASSDQLRLESLTSPGCLKLKQLDRL